MDHYLWYSLPLIVSISLVYAATRHEAVDLILLRALRVGVLITGFSLLVFLVLWCIDRFAV
jgi:hypothetical protein